MTTWALQHCIRLSLTQHGSNNISDNAVRIHSPSNISWMHAQFYPHREVYHCVIPYSVPPRIRTDCCRVAKNSDSCNCATDVVNNRSCHTRHHATQPTDSTDPTDRSIRCTNDCLASTRHQESDPSDGRRTATHCSRARVAVGSRTDPYGEPRRIFLIR
jgi:hypothetical protein